MDAINTILSRLDAMEKRLDLIHEDVRRTGETTARIKLRLDKIAAVDGREEDGARGSNDA